MNEARASSRTLMVELRDSGIEDWRRSDGHIIKLIAGHVSKQLAGLHSEPARLAPKLSIRIILP